MRSPKKKIVQKKGMKMTLTTGLEIPPARKYCALRDDAQRKKKGEKKAKDQKTFLNYKTKDAKNDKKGAKPPR